jgi:hypothetical protein
MAHWPLLTYLNYTTQMTTVLVVTNCIVVILSRKHLLQNNFHFLILQNESRPVDWPAINFFKKQPLRENQNNAYGWYLLRLPD